MSSLKEQDKNKAIEIVAETFAQLLVAFIDDMESKKGKEVDTFSEKIIN